MFKIVDKLESKRSRLLTSFAPACKAKHIGIVACSAEGAALCFREIATYSLKLRRAHASQVTLAASRLASGSRIQSRRL